MDIDKADIVIEYGFKKPDGSIAWGGEGVMANGTRYYPNEIVGALNEWRELGDASDIDRFTGRLAFEAKRIGIDPGAYIDGWSIVKRQIITIRTEAEHHDTISTDPMVKPKDPDDVVW